MIRHALTLLQSELNGYIISIPGNNATDYVAPGNVALLEGDPPPTDLEEKVIIGMVNVEEESVFKNLPNFTKTANGAVRYQNAPVYLNLYLLFVSNFKDYSTSLAHLSEVIQFFQGKKSFNLKNAPAFQNGADLPDPDLADLQLILDLYTMTFEQINHLWGSLGGKQKPFVLYKARLVKIFDRRTTGSGVLIEEVGNEGRAIAPDGA